MSYLALLLTTESLPADWVGRVERLWTQDDAVPDEDTVALAWRRLFGGDLPGRDRWIASLDRGDHDVHIDALGRVYVASYPGANEFGVLRGGPADVCPRLVISGGQTGADRGALDAALELGWPIGGWVPRGWRAEDGEVPEPYRSHLWEAESTSYAARTRDNVSDSTGTLVVSRSAKLSGGSLLTWEYAHQISRPRFHVALNEELVDDRDLPLDTLVDQVFAWLDEHRVGVLHVAGPRESKCPGIGKETRALVHRVLERAAERRAPAVASTIAATSSDVTVVDECAQVTTEVADDLGRAMAARMTAAASPWSPSQEVALARVSRWLADPSAPQVFYLAGVAGSGKSTLARHLVEQSGRRWLYAAYTGKAALVMERKGCAGARTIHSLIYRPEGQPVVDDDGRAHPVFRLWQDSPLWDAYGVVIDECSMVDEELGKDLLSFGRRVLILGDMDQLPPVDGAGFFTHREPDAVLTEVHRQARDSGILELATLVREGGGVDLSRFVGWRRDDCEVTSRDRIGPALLWQRMIDADQVIVGRNDTRHKMNARYRQLSQTGSDLPVPGDKVICLRNERKAGLFNGSMWCVRSATPSGPRTLDLEIDTLDDLDPPRLVSRTWDHHFLAREHELAGMGVVRGGFQEFAYARFITCHKAQGSQWDDVVLYDESRIFRADRNKWLYTGITRAARRLLVVV